jgi:hypothetical protein
MQPPYRSYADILMIRLASEKDVYSGRQGSRVLHYLDHRATPDSDCPKRLKASPLVLRAAQRLAERASVTSVQLRETQLREYFGKFGAYTKHQIAYFLLANSRSLHTGCRHPGDFGKERARMSIFDAVSCGVTYFSMTDAIGNEIYG